METQEYIPYGEAWKRSVMRMPKAELVDLAATIGKQNRKDKAVPEYSLYGDEWKAQVSKLSKAAIVELAAQIGKGK